MPRRPFASLCGASSRATRAAAAHGAPQHCPNLEYSPQPARSPRVRLRGRTPKRVTLAIANERSSNYNARWARAAGDPGRPSSKRRFPQLVCGGVTAEIDGDSYVMARVGDGVIAASEQFQLELSRARSPARDSDFFTPPSFRTASQHAFGGVARRTRARGGSASGSARLRGRGADPAVQTFASDAVPGQAIEVLREEPCVAVVGLRDQKQCRTSWIPLPRFPASAARMWAALVRRPSRRRANSEHEFGHQREEPEAPVTMAAIAVSWPRSCWGEDVKEVGQIRGRVHEDPYEAQNLLISSTTRSGLSVSASKRSRRWRGAGIELF